MRLPSVRRLRPCYVLRNLGMTFMAVSCGGEARGHRAAHRRKHLTDTCQSSPLPAGGTLQSLLPSLIRTVGRCRSERLVWHGYAQHCNRFGTGAGIGGRAVGAVTITASLGSVSARVTVTASQGLRLLSLEPAPIQEVLVRGASR